MIQTSPTYFNDRSSPAWGIAPPRVTLSSALWWGGAGLTAAIAVAPFLLPAIGVGSMVPMLSPGGENMALQSLEQITAFEDCIRGGATGLAGLTADILRPLPWVGETLAQGGVWNGVAAGGVALGGTLAANYYQEKTPNHYHVAQIVRAATMATTALIAAPAILSALSMGLHYLSLVAGTQLYDGNINQFSGVKETLFSTLGKLGEQGAAGAATLQAGASGSIGGALSASSLLVTHALSCGVAASIGGAAISSSAQHSAHAHANPMMPNPMTRVQSPTVNYQQRAMPSLGAMKTLQG